MLKLLSNSLVGVALVLSMNVASAQGGMGSGQGGRGGGERPDFTEAAEALGITQDQLLEALGGPPPDFAAAAEKLGVTEERLMEVVPAPPQRGGGSR